MPGWLLGSVLLIFGAAGAVAERRGEGVDIAVLDEFVSRCAELQSSYDVFRVVTPVDHFPFGVGVIIVAWSVGSGAGPDLADPAP